MKLNFRIAALTLAATCLAPVAWSASTTSADESSLISQGNTQWTAGKLDEARKSFEQAVVVSPRSIDAHMKLAGLLLASGKYDAAIKTYQKTISLDSKNVRAWMGLGLAYRHAGDRELASSAFEEAVRLEPARKAQLAKLMENPAH